MFFFFFLQRPKGSKRNESPNNPLVSQCLNRGHFEGFHFLDSLVGLGKDVLMLGTQKNNKTLLRDLSDRL